MGQSSSLPVDVDYSDVPTLGYRVLGVQPDSPASKAGLVSFFDFLVGSNGRMLFGGSTEEDDEGKVEMVGDIDFISLLQENVEKELELLVFNIKSQQTRLCYVTPSTNWGGAGLLGVTIRVDSYAHAEDNLLRVLSVMDSSPAQMAGLKSETDYLLGTKTASFTTDDILYQVLRSNCDKVLEIYVYNTESDIVRVLNIMPTYSWGGGGLLGAEVGMGYLHKLPKTCRDTDGSSFEKKVKLPFGKLPAAATTATNGVEKKAAVENDDQLDPTKEAANDNESPPQVNAKESLEKSDAPKNVQSVNGSENAAVAAATPPNANEASSQTTNESTSEKNTVSPAYTVPLSPAQQRTAVSPATDDAPSSRTTSSVPPPPISDASDGSEAEEYKPKYFSSYLPPPPFSFRSSNPVGNES